MSAARWRSCAAAATKRGLHHRSEDRGGIELPGGQRQAGIGECAERLHRGDQHQCHTGGNAGTQDGGTATGQRRFSGHEHEPHHERRIQPAGEGGQIPDKGGEDGERRGFEVFEGDLCKGEHGEERGREQAHDGGGFGDIGAADEADKRQRQKRAEARFRHLYRKESLALGPLFLRITFFTDKPGADADEILHLASRFCTS